MEENNITVNTIENDELQEENEDAQIIQSRKIFTKTGDPEVISLYNKFKDGDLVLQPDFQRHFVWDIKKSSRLIESALLDIPLPIIYLSEDEDGKEYVIDGQQRLTAFFSFIDGQFFNSKKPFSLSGLKVRSDLKNHFYANPDKTVKSLSDKDKKKIKSYVIRTITFQKESDINLKYEIFERLNTGAVALNEQELRNCMFRGPYNELLKELAADKDFMRLLGLTEPEIRMRDIELVLRFSAFYHSTYLKYKPPIRAFLNEDMRKYRNITNEDEQDLKKSFKNAVSLISSLFEPKQAFRRYYKGSEKNPNGRWEPKKFNYSLFDILMYSLSNKDKNIVMRNLDSIREALIVLMSEDQDFIDSIELSTSSIKAVTTRFDMWRKTLDAIVGIDEKEARLYTKKFKEKLFQSDSTCQICGNQIVSIDDAAVDHIEQYWLGGKTIPENARLTHRYCNCARLKKEPV